MNMHLTNADTIQVKEFDPISYAREDAARRDRLMGKPKSVNVLKDMRDAELTAMASKEAAAKGLVDAEIKELEVELRKLQTLNDLRRRVIEQREALDASEIQTLPYSMAKVMMRFCRLFKIKPNELTSRRNGARVVFIRQAVAYWTVRLTGMSYPAIASKLGNRDHSTLMQSVAIYPLKRKQMGRTLKSVTNYTPRPVTGAWLTAAFPGKPKRTVKD